MKKLIILPIIAMSINTKSGTIEKHKELRQELELIDDTINWVKSESIKRDMRARKNKLINKYYE